MKKLSMSAAVVAVLSGGLLLSSTTMAASVVTKAVVDDEFHVKCEPLGAVAGPVLQANMICAPFPDRKPLDPESEKLPEWLMPFEDNPHVTLTVVCNVYDDRQDKEDWNAIKFKGKKGKSILNQVKKEVYNMLADRTYVEIQAHLRHDFSVNYKFYYGHASCSLLSKHAEEGLHVGWPEID